MNHTASDTDAATSYDARATAATAVTIATASYCNCCCYSCRNHCLKSSTAAEAVTVTITTAAIAQSVTKIMPMDCNQRLSGPLTMITLMFSEETIIMETILQVGDAHDNNKNVLGCGVYNVRDMVDNDSRLPMPVISSRVKMTTRIQ